MDDFVDIDLNNRGEILPPKTGKIALIDADTIVFASCSVCEYEEELLDRDFYTDAEWEDLQTDPGFYIREDGGASVRGISIVEAYDHSMDKINTILESTGCIDFELHFTSGRKSFRYTMIDSQYKANRVGLVGTYGIYDLKKFMCGRYPTKAFIWKDWEADDIVVSLKRDNYDKYMLCAVDKDVLYTIPGQHFNYYQSIKYSIDMKFIEVSEEQAIQHHYIQTLTGDAGDGVIGLHLIGPKKAKKLLGSETDPKKMWDIVVKAYESHKDGRTVIEAINNMRMVNMHQLVLDKNNNYGVKLWHP